MKKIQNEEKKHEDFKQDYKVDKRGGFGRQSITEKATTDCADSFDKLRTDNTELRKENSGDRTRNSEGIYY